MSRIPQLIELLKATLDKLEQSERRDTPEMQELKRRLALAMAEMEVAKAKTPDSM